jgi:hypothetical protein
MSAPPAHRYCIVCGQMFDGTGSDDALCPAHAGRAAEGAGPPGFTAQYALARTVPPLVDVAIGFDEVVYVLDSTLAGQACSVAAWKDGEFVSSSMLKVPEPLHIGTLDDGRVVVVGGGGTVVVLGGLATADENRLPSTVGHQFHTHITCAAHQPGTSVLALGAPERDAVLKVDLPGFDESTWVGGVTARPVALAFSGRGDALATGLDDGSLLVVETQHGAPRWAARPSTFDGVGVVACAAGAGGGWVVAYESQHLAVWDETGRLRSAVRCEFPLTAVHADLASGRVAVGGVHGEVSVRSADLQQVLVSGRPHDGAVVYVVALPEPGVAITGCEDGQATLLG